MQARSLVSALFSESKSEPRKRILVKAASAIFTRYDLGLPKWICNDWELLCERSGWSMVQGSSDQDGVLAQSSSAQRHTKVLKQDYLVLEWFANLYKHQQGYKEPCISRTRFIHQHWRIWEDLCYLRSLNTLKRESARRLWSPISNAAVQCIDISNSDWGLAPYTSEHQLLTWYMEHGDSRIKFCKEVSCYGCLDENNRCYGSLWQRWGRRTSPAVTGIRNFWQSVTVRTTLGTAD